MGENRKSACEVLTNREFLNNAQKFSFIFDASDDDVDLTSLTIIVYKFVRNGEENYHLHFKPDERDTFIRENNIH